MNQDGTFSRAHRVRRIPHQALKVQGMAVFILD